jgi:hypothetical protein
MFPPVAQLEEYAWATFTRSGWKRQEIWRIAFTRDFKYDPKATSIDMPLSDVLRNRKGVCQDFARDDRSHAVAETAARYVSRYVSPGPKVQGAQVSHA